MHESDRAVVAMVRGGDGNAFRALVERHSRYVFNVALRMTGRAEDAEEIVQDSFMKAYRQLDRFEGRSEFRTWLHRITVHCAIDFIRARRPDAALEPIDAEVGPSQHTTDEPAPDRLVASGEIRSRVTAAMERLSALERAAFTLRHLEGQSIREISDALGLKTEATKQSIFRAVRKMRIALEPMVQR